jgi:hypothetical protein
MAGNSKPRKQRTYRLASVPKLIDIGMTRDQHPMLAMQLHAALITMIDSPTIDTCNHMSEQLCKIAGGMSWANKGHPIIGKRDSHSIAIHSAILAIESIVDRHQKYDIVSVSKFEADTLRSAAGILDTALGNIPSSCYERASREIEELLGVD